MKNLNLIIAFLFIICSSFLNGQSVGINNPTPDPSAALDIESTDKGILIPRVTTDQRFAIVGIGGGSPATGLMVYDMDKSSFYFFNGSIWVNLLDNVTDTDWTETPTSVYTSRKVGIGDGINNPVRTLEVGGLNQQYIRVKSINHMRSGIEFMQQGTGNDWRIENSDGYLDFMVSPDDYITEPNIQATITNSGRLGLGLLEPARVLDAGGEGIQYLRVRSTNANANGIEFMRQGLPGRDWRMTNNNGFFDIGSSSDDLATSTTHATFTSTGRLGIGSLNPSKELHVIGTIRSSNLAGLGNRTILANSDGDLIAGSPSPATQVWSVNGLAFYSVGPEFNYSSIAWNYTGNAPLYAPVNLPQGATVTSMTVNFGDASPTNDIRIILGRIEIPVGGIPSVLAEITSSGSVSSSQIIIDSIIDNPIINNNLYAYVIKVSPLSSWDFNYLNIRSVRISYLNP